MHESKHNPIAEEGQRAEGRGQGQDREDEAIFSNPVYSLNKA